jgi:drug/metabolite transporter (DMT)-like permease
MSEDASRRATTPRQEFLGAAFTVAMAVQFSVVVILGKSVLHGKLPFVILSLRFIGTAAILLALLVITGRPLVPERGERLGLVIAGTAGYGTEAAFYFTALNHGSAAAVTLLFYTYPAIVMLATIALDRKPPRPLLWVALGLAVGGSAIVVIGGAGVQVETVGIVLALFCAVAYSAYLIGTDRILKRTNPMTSALWLAGSAASANAIFAIAFRATTLPGGFDQWWRIGAMWVFTTGAFITMLAGLQRIGAVRNGIIGVLEPLSVAVLAWLFLGEPVTVSTALGGTLILGGAVAAALVRTTSVAEPNV